MSMSSPFEPHLADQPDVEARDGIPAADPGGPGAPEPAPGYGTDPDPADDAPAGEAPAEERSGGDPPFRTPDPADLADRG